MMARIGWEAYGLRLIESRPTMTSSSSVRRDVILWEPNEEHTAIVIVGIAPAPSVAEGDPPFSLKTSTGRRLRHLVGGPVLSVYAGANVLMAHDDSPGGPMARARGAMLRSLLQGRSVVVLGYVVARLLELERVRYFDWAKSGRGRNAIDFAICPHPSGLNRWWNTEPNRRAARSFFDDLATRRGR